jgi:hypothetical protein
MHAACSPLCCTIVSGARSDTYFLIDALPPLAVVEADCSSTQSQFMARPHKMTMIQYNRASRPAASRPAGMFEFQRTDERALGTLLDAGRVSPRCKKARVRYSVRGRGGGSGISSFIQSETNEEKIASEIYNLQGQACTLKFK